MRDRPKVGEILVQAGIIDELQLAAALGEQTRWGRRLGMTLIKLGMVQEGHLVRALAKQFDLPVASLAGKKIAPDVLALVPAKFACEHSVVPLFVKKDGPKGQLFLGMEEPSDLGVLDDLAFRTGMMIRPVMVGPTEIGEAIDRYYMTRSAPPTASTAPALPDPERAADTLSETNLRRIREEAGPSPAPLSNPSEIPAPVEPMAGLVIAADAATPAAAVSPEPIEEITAPVPLARIAISRPVPIHAPVAVSSAGECPSPSAPRDAIPSELARVLEESERTRLVAKAIAHLLIEKGILELEELQARIEKMKTKPSGSGV